VSVFEKALEKQYTKSTKKGTKATKKKQKRNES